MKKQQPNVLLVCVDHWPGLLMRSAGHERILTPTLDQLCGKPPMQEYAAKIPMILVPTADYARAGHHQVDDRLCELKDVMPTLLDLCNIPIPETVEGVSLVSDRRRDHLYAEHFEDELAVRMVRSGPHKLIWYPAGNRFHLLDLDRDPREMHDLSNDPQQAETRTRLQKMLRDHLYGTDLEWVEGDRLVGFTPPDLEPEPNRSHTNQRGWR